MRLRVSWQDWQLRRGSKAFELILKTSMLPRNIVHRNGIQIGIGNIQEYNEKRT